MITAEFRDKFKKDLGENFNYSPPVKLILNEMGVKNRDGNDFSSQSIRNVFNGDRENRAIETAIMICYKREVKLNYEYTSIKNSLKESSTNPNPDKK